MEDYGIKAQFNRRRANIAQSMGQNDQQQNDLKKSLQDFLQKGKAADEGEEREWGGKKYKKTGGKWIPVTKDKKGKEDEPSKDKGAKKDESGSKKSSNSQASQGADNHEVAQMTYMKKVMDENPEKAYEIFQSLSPEAQEKVPQDVVNKLVEASYDEGEDAADKVFADEEVGERAYQVIQYASDLLGRDGYFDRETIQEEMKEQGVTEKEVLESWKNDWDEDQWNANEIKELMEAIADDSKKESSSESKYNFPSDKDSFRESVSRMRSVYNTLTQGSEDELKLLGYTKEQAKKKADKMEDWFDAAKDHKKKLDKKDDTVKKAFEILGIK